MHIFFLLGMCFIMDCAAAQDPRRIIHNNMFQGVSVKAREGIDNFPKRIQKMLFTALEAIKEKYNIDTELWRMLLKGCVAITKEEKRIESRPSFSVIHSVSEQTVYILRYYSQKNNLDVNAINVCHNYGGLLSVQFPSIPYACDLHDGLAWNAYVDRFFPATIMLPEEPSEACLYLAVQSLVKHINFRPLLSAINLLYPTADVLETSNEWLRLKKIQLLYPMICVAVEDEKCAIAMRQCLSQNIYQFDENDCALFDEIIGLWQLRNVNMKSQYRENESTIKKRGKFNEKNVYELNNYYTTFDWK